MLLPNLDDDKTETWKMVPTQIPFSRLADDPLNDERIEIERKYVRPHIRMYRFPGKKKKNRLC